jgi:hypothetical protein
MPYSNGTKERPNPTKPLGERRRFYFDKGKQPALYMQDTIRPSSTVFLVEGETDTMRLQQELRDDGTDTSVVGLSGINTWRSELAETFENADRVLVILDNDYDYMVVDQVEKAWRDIRNDLGKKARRVRLPHNVKDVCEFFDLYDLEHLRLVAKKGTGTSRYKPLDLTKPPPPPKWLIQDLVSLGDVTLLPGDPGLGKSWLTMGMCVAVAEGWTHLLHSEVKKQGRVLYVDGENPDDVVYHRLNKLGLTNKGQQNIRYLWNQGIRLDRNAEEFLDEALDFEPELIVLDSLTRLHTKDENNNGEISALFNDGIQPLARETGAAVLLIHHTNKAGGTRGATDIEGSVDNVLHIVSAGNMGKFLLRQGKSRRRLGGDEIVVEIRDDPTGSGAVTLEAGVPIVPPF